MFECRMGFKDVLYILDQPRSPLQLGAVALQAGTPSSDPIALFSRFGKSSPNPPIINSSSRSAGREPEKYTDYLSDPGR